MDKQKLSKIKRVFKQAPVEVVYFFGSRVIGKAGPISDYDFGVLIEPVVKSKQPLLVGQLMDKLFPIVGFDRAEVVDLEDKPALFRFKVIKDGQVILNRNETRRVKFEVETMRQFHDEKYYLDQEMHQVIDRIEKGGFFDRRLLPHYKTA